jgi:hypothetical protein
MNSQALRDRVEAARLHEQSRTVLDGWLDARLPDLHPAIMAEREPKGALLGFIDAYIAQVPDMLEAAQGVAEQARLQSHLLPVLKVAEAFFLQPPDLPADHQGMLALLDEAYLAHRLVDEINDRYVAHGCGPLIPLDMARANLIAHQLLGEPFANELDEMVEQAVRQLVPESLFEGQAFRDYRASLDRDSCRALWEKWPCMSERLGMEIRWRGLD